MPINPHSDGRGKGKQHNTFAYQVYRFFKPAVA